MIGSRSIRCALVGAVAVAALALQAAPENAVAMPPPCYPNCGGSPTPAPTTYTKVIATGHGQRDFQAEHQSTDAELVVEYRTSDNQPIGAYVNTQTHAWDENWFDGFVAVDQVHVVQDGYDAESTPQHRLTVCGTWDPAACSDRWSSSSDAVPLYNVLGALQQDIPLTLRVDVDGED